MTAELDSKFEWDSPHYFRKATERNRKQQKAFIELFKIGDSVAESVLRISVCYFSWKEVFEGEHEHIKATDGNNSIGRVG